MASHSGPDSIGSLTIVFIPQKLSDVGSELSIQLPMSASAQFPALFAQLEGESARLGIETYGECASRVPIVCQSFLAVLVLIMILLPCAGISVTTLEEVFLKVAEIGTLEEREANKRLSRQISNERALSFSGEPAVKGSLNEPVQYTRESAIQGESAFFFVRRCGCSKRLFFYSLKYRFLYHADPLPCDVQQAFPVRHS